LHEKNICHRDLKPENILYESPEENSIIKVIDFGLSKKVEGVSLNSMIGTPFYMAPEVIDGTYDLACDMWSIGVITFQLLTGEVPFYGKNKASVFEKIKTCNYDFKEETWS